MQGCWHLAWLDTCYSQGGEFISCHYMHGTVHSQLVCVPLVLLLYPDQLFMQA